MRVRRASRSLASWSNWIAVRQASSTARARSSTERPRHPRSFRSRGQRGLFSDTRRIYTPSPVATISGGSESFRRK